MQFPFHPHAPGVTGLTFILTDPCSGGGAGTVADRQILQRASYSVSKPEKLDWLRSLGADHPVSACRAALTPRRIYVGAAGPDASDFSETTTCPKSLAPGGACSISVEFTPKATGARTAILAITDNGGASPQKVALTGTGQ